MRRMQITLSTEQTATVLEAAGKWVEAEVNADCEPSGYGLEISITAAARWAEAVIGGERIDLGDVSVELIDEGTH